MSVTESLTLAVEKACGQRVEHLESVPVIETFRGKVLWEGMVEIYTLPLSPPERAYAWTENEGSDDLQFIVIRGLPPINSPLDAVRAWIVSQIRKN